MDIDDREVSAYGLADTKQAGGKRRRWPEALKRELVAALLEPGASVSIVARRYDVNANQLFKWRRQFAGVSGGLSTEPLRLLPVEIAPTTAQMAEARGGQSILPGHRRARSRLRCAAGQGADQGRCRSGRGDGGGRRGDGGAPAPVIPPPSGTRVWLATGHTDMRRGMNGLALQVQEVLRRDPYGGHLFVFRGRRGDLIKVLWHDGQGMCLFAKRLERGRFIWPSPADGVVTIIPAQLGYLLEGIDWRMPQRTWRPDGRGLRSTATF